MSAQRRVLMQPATLLAILASVGVLAATGEDPSERPTPPAPLIEAADSHLYLIGDAGAPAKEEPVFRALREDVSRDPGPSVVVFLGDNIYPQGLPAPHSSDRKESERRLEAQLELVRSSGARGIFLPGNRDWAAERRAGLGRHSPAGSLCDRRATPAFPARGRLSWSGGTRLRRAAG